MTNIERHILLLGSGYVAAPTVEYLVRRPENKITIASRSYDNAIKLSKKFPGTSPAQLDIDDEASVDNLVCRHGIVISLIPYIHHAKVIKSAIKYKKNVVTTSYVSPAMMELDEAAKEAGITVMNEIGLDPGIDHLYAVKIIDEVHKEGGKILSFLSYCGGLPAPESSNNPLGYKFSWSSRGVLLALRNQARFLQDGEIVTVEGPELMKSAKPIHVYPAFNVVGYANRDSSHYPQRYNMPECQTCLRGTLRYQVFPSFVQTLTDLGFLSEEPKDYLSPDSPDITWRQVLANILNTTNDEQSLSQAILEKSPIESESEIERIFHGFKWLGLFSDTIVTKRASNLLDTLCATLEQKMAYGENERDMVLLQHKFKVELADGTIQTRTSTLLEYGTPNGHSAMALTVGYPCGIATQLVLDGVINQKGVLAPMTAEINQPLIEAIEKEGIGCIEETL